VKVEKHRGRAAGLDPWRELPGEEEKGISGGVFDEGVTDVFAGEEAD